MDTFDASNAMARLAAGLNINRDQVALKVTAGSVRVEGTISFTNAPDSADTVQSQLSEVLSNSSRVLAIFGLPLESVDQMPMVNHKLLLLTSVPHPPSPSPVTSVGNVDPVEASPDADLGILAVLLGVGGVLLCGILTCGILICCIRRHRARHHQKERSAAGAIGQPASAAEGSSRPQSWIGEPPGWPDLFPTDATSAELVFSTGKFPDRKTSVYASDPESAYEFSRLDNAERRRRRKESLCAGDECYSGATGTKDAPENPSGFRRTLTHDRLATPVPPPPRHDPWLQRSVTTASSPPPRHDHFDTTLPPPSRRHTLAANALPPPSHRHRHSIAAPTLPPPSRRHTVAATAMPPPPRRQSLGSTEPPAWESGDASRYRCSAQPGRRRTSVYV